MKLKNRLALGPGEMLHIGGPVAKRPGRHRPGGRLIKFVSHADIERSRDDGYMLYLGVPVRWNLEAVWKRKPHCEKTFFAGIALQYRNLGPRRQ